MAELNDIVDYCNQRLRTAEIIDFTGAENGLQFANSGRVTKIGAAVDAGKIPFQMAIDKGIDFLIVHHGMFWNPPYPVVAKNYQKFKLLLDSNCAVYASHLPLDCHPEIGNNAIIAQQLKLDISNWEGCHEGTPMAAMASCPYDRKELADRLQTLFPDSYTAIEHGSDKPSSLIILSGSGRSIIPHMKSIGVDTLITGELRQEHYNLAQEEGLNLYPCGHYATEVFGVKALAEELANKFGLPWEFIQMDCPL